MEGYLSCYVIDLKTDICDPDTTHAAHATLLLKQLMREMKLEELGI